MKKIYGYVRGSSKEQKLDIQIEEIKKYVIYERGIIKDNKSRKCFDRKGDILGIKELDML